MERRTNRKNTKMRQVFCAFDKSKNKRIISMKEELLGVKGDEVYQEYYQWFTKQQYDKNWEHLPDYMKKPKWFNRELKIDEILKEDDV